MNETKNSGFMALIGRLVTVCSFIVASITIIKYFAEPKSDLTAQIRLYEFSVPRDFNDREQRLLESSYPPAFDDYFLKHIDKITEEQRQDSRAFAITASDFIRGIVREPHTLRSNIRGFVNIVVKNEGTKTISGAQVFVPNLISYEVERGGKTDFSLSSDSIGLGSIKPRETISINCWMSYPPISVFTDNINVVHDEGLAAVEYFTPVSSKSFGSFISKWGILIFPVITMGIIFIVAITLDALSISKRKSDDRQNNKKNLEDKDQEVLCPPSSV
jgi:hypothetical protein